ncbi:unnamed protein product, partial [Didymodactylos carnosus]
NCLQSVVIVHLLSSPLTSHDNVQYAVLVVTD